MESAQSEGRGHLVQRSVRRMEDDMPPRALAGVQETRDLVELVSLGQGCKASSVAKGPSRLRACGCWTPKKKHGKLSLV